MSYTEYSSGNCDLNLNLLTYIILQLQFIFQLIFCLLQLYIQVFYKFIPECVFFLTKKFDRFFQQNNSMQEQSLPISNFRKALQATSVCISRYITITKTSICNTSGVILLFPSTALRGRMSLFNICSYEILININVKIIDLFNVYLLILIFNRNTSMA